MKKKIKWMLVGTYGLLFVINIVLLFFITGQLEGRGAFKGNMIVWVIGIVMSLFSLTFLIPWNKIKKPNFKLAIIFLTLITINILMGIFSLLDIVGIKNYAVSSVMFISVPVATILTYSLLK